MPTPDFRDLDLGLVQVAGPRGRELLDYVAADRRRVTSAAAMPPANHADAPS